MSDSVFERRKFIVASRDESLRQNLTAYLESEFRGAIVVAAVDGSDAIFKLSNDLPNIIFIDGQMNHLAAVRVVDWVNENVKDHHMSMIIMGQVPDQEIFVDQVATGQLQFLPDVQNKEKLRAATFRGLNYALVDQNAEFNLHYLADAEILIREGEKAKSVYILRKGRLRAYSKYRDESEIVLGYIEPGEFVGEMAYINGEPCSAHVRAEEDCELIEIPIERLDHVLYTKPAWSKALMRTLSKRVKVANVERIKKRIG
jgi:CheY-like chemotaxis protein